MRYSTTPPAHFGPDHFPDFPGPIVLAAEPDAGWQAAWEASAEDGRPYDAKVRYRSTAGLVPLFIRTVLPGTDPSPAARTTHDLATTLLDMRTTAFGHRATPGRGRTPTKEDFRALSQAARHEEAHTESRPWVVSIDGVEVHGYRKDFMDGSVAEVQWDRGIRVLCAGDTNVLNRLKLCSRASISWDETR